jgi:hypothetical protein
MEVFSFMQGQPALSVTLCYLLTMDVVKVQLQWKIYWIFKFFQVRQHRA